MENINKEELEKPEIENPEMASPETNDETLNQSVSSDGEAEAKENVEKKKKSFFGKKKDSELEKLKEQLEESNAKVAEIHDKYIRLYSEFDNFRKRTQKEKIDIIKNASEDMIVNLLPIIDDFERALANFNSSEEMASTKEGVSLIYQKMMRILNQKGLKLIEAKDKIFDTDFHEAITFIPLPEGVEPNTVIDEIEKGYLLNEKVIRYSKVVIAK
jgi:molecular chaperone GrpE